MSTAGSRGRRKPNERRRRPAVTSHVYRMCGHLDAPFAFVSRAGNVTVRFHSDHDRQASGFSVGYVTYSRTYDHHCCSVHVDDFLLHDLLSSPISHHCVWSGIAGHNLTLTPTSCLRNNIQLITAVCPCSGCLLAYTFNSLQYHR